MHTKILLTNLPTYASVRTITEDFLSNSIIDVSHLPTIYQPYVPITQLPTSSNHRKVHLHLSTIHVHLLYIYLPYKYLHLPTIQIPTSTYHTNTYIYLPWKPLMMLTEEWMPRYLWMKLTLGIIVFRPVTSQGTSKHLRLSWCVLGTIFVCLKLGLEAWQKVVVAFDTGGPQKYIMDCLQLHSPLILLIPKGFAWFKKYEHWFFCFKNKSNP